MIQRCATIDKRQKKKLKSVLKLQMCRKSPEAAYCMLTEKKEIKKYNMKSKNTPRDIKTRVDGVT